MTALFDYLLQASVILALFYAIYFLILRNERFFVEIRIYLIVSILLSLLLPFVKVPYTVLVEMVQTSVLVAIQANPIAMFSETIETVAIKQEYFSIADMLLAGYFLVATVLFIRSLIKVGQICKMVLGKEYTVVDDCKVVILDKAIPAFTFFGYIVMNREEFTDESRTNIVIHEKVHAKQKHWIDLLLVELLTILFWFNPFVWLYQIAIKQTHELLADDGVIARDFNIGQYQATLINQLMGTEVLGLANNFNHSITKKRMIMMSKEKSPKNRRYKFLVTIPVIAIVVIFNMKPVVVQAVEKETTKEVDPIELVASNSIEKDSIYNIVDEMPQFPGGISELQKWVSRRLKYPVTAIENNIEGTVFVAFVVNKIGKVVHPRIVRGVDPFLDAEAIRVIKLMPNWKPGKHKGEIVNVSYTMPINFGLTKKSKDSVKYYKGEKIHTIVDKMPEFSGGTKAFQKYIADNVKYPVEAQKNGIAGRVFVNFIVSKEGDVDQVRIVRGVDPSLDGEAIRVIKTMQKWKPGKLKGVAVNMMYTVPITFSLK